ncbi:hypothetical protein JHK87_037273 [Glycine soja]|nr:hypothetical protein JHK87_037273 [Glycine soja]
MVPDARFLSPAAALCTIDYWEAAANPSGLRGAARQGVAFGKGFDGLAPLHHSVQRRVPNSNVEEVGLTVATDLDGKSVEKMAPHVNEPVYAWRNDSFVAAFPSEVVRITYGINFSQVKIG